MQHNSSPAQPTTTPLQRSLLRLVAACPASRVPPPTLALWADKLRHLPDDVADKAIEKVIDTCQGKWPHFSTILGVASTIEPRGVAGAEPQTAWEFAGVGYDAFEKLLTSAKRYHLDRWRARCEARRRYAGNSAGSSYFAPEPLDDVLTRFSLDSRGGVLENFLGPATHEEDHIVPDNRHWKDIASEARRKHADRIDAILERNALRREESAGV